MCLIFSFGFNFFSTPGKYISGPSCIKSTAAPFYQEQLVVNFQAFARRAAVFRSSALSWRTFSVSVLVLVFAVRSFIQCTEL